MTFRSVCAMGFRFPGVVETTMYGGPALKLGKRLIACMATNKQAEKDTLIVRTDFEQRDLLIAEEPDVYYLKDHYKSFPVVLVRLKRVSPDAMRDLLGGAVRVVDANQPKRRSAPRRRKS